MGAADGQGLDAAGEGIAMNIKGYDAWKLSGPDDDRCPECGGSHEVECQFCDGTGEVVDEACWQCEGTGTIHCESCGGEEPDGDHQYERKRDREYD